jgi:predicted permease
MALTFRDIWMTINKALTAINSLLLMLVLGGSLYDSKKKRHIKIPLIANIILLLVLATAAGAYIYKFFIA